MKHYPWRFLIVVLAIIMMLIISGSALAKGEVVEITSPTEGESVVGIIDVTGTVDFSDFMKYEMFLKTGGEMIWAATVYAPVINGTLAKLDTRIYPDGLYQIIIRTVKSDSNYTEHVGPTFAVENNLGAPLPNPEIASSPLYAPTAGAVARYTNCSGDNLEIDYHSPTGFCSADDLWIPYKHQDSDVCPYVDVLLIPDCSYEGTARGQGQDKGVGYSLTAEAGKVYLVTYAGGTTIYAGEIEPDERADTDTGGLSPDDPARGQTTTVVVVEKTTVEVVAEAPAEEAEEVLPISGQGQNAPSISFIIAAVALILFLVIAGIVAMRKRGQPV